MRAHLLDLFRDRRGAIAAILGVSLIPLVIAGGAAIDASRAYLVRARLSSALDAAGLAVGSSTGTEAEMKVIADRFFRKNYPDASLGRFVSLNVSITPQKVTLSAERQLDTLFMRFAGFSTIPVRSQVEITREVKGLEVALALDNTGSMASDGKISALRTSATDLVNILFGDNSSPDKLKMALVPFVTNVNIGTAFQSVVDPTSLATANFKGTSWLGCVTERPYPHNIQDTSIAAGGTWKAYSWPKEPRYQKNNQQSSGDSQCMNPARSTDLTRWSSISEPTAAGQNQMPDGSGPNKGCPRPAIHQLDNDKAALLSDISKMRPWDGTGTMTHVGLSWALRAISPNEPFKKGLPYGTEGWNKAIILMTDGQNDLIVQDSDCYNATDTNSSHPQGKYTAFTGEGYPVDDNTFGVSGSTKSAKYNNVRTRLNELTAEACSFVKSRGVVLYTILLQVPDTATQNLYRTCATDPSKFFDVPTASELNGAFRAIAEDLSNLRVSK
jgi:Flp pilus assembly protein TadG